MKYDSAVEALRDLLAVLNDRNRVGTNVDGRWMGIPAWEQVDAATRLVNELVEQAE
jgi:hypothetical protein